MRTLLLSAFVLSILISRSTACAQAPVVFDTSLTVQSWTSGLNQPTGAAVVNSRGDMFVIEKATGKVQHIYGRRVRRTLLDLPVNSENERGLLGMALSPTFAQDNFVYLYQTVAATDGGAPIANAIQRYQYDGEKLVFKKTLRTLPVLPGPNHNGGKMSFGPDGKLYVQVGDLNLNEATSNYAGKPINRNSAILRLEPFGGSPTDNPFYAARNTGTRNAALNDIYAYGVRNGFGLAFDPVTGKLWDSENGRDKFDEINLINPGTNSGWERIMGPANRNGGVPGNLVSLGASAEYSDPEFSWLAPVAPTDLLFMPNGRLGAQYRGDLFVGTVRGGKILRFEMNADRDGFILAKELQDLVADSTANNRFLESGSLTFGQEFGTITDLFAGAGGMYVLSLSHGTIYRITTAGATPSSIETRAMVAPEPALGSALLIAAVFMRRRRTKP